MSDPKQPRTLEPLGSEGDARAFSPSTARNKDALLDALTPHFVPGTSVLEVASGTGEHGIHFCRHLPDIFWQPTDIAKDALQSIDAWHAHEAVENYEPPLRLDVTAAGWWGNLPGDYNAMLCCNMIHIAPWEAALGLIGGAGHVLPEGGLFVLYGPFSKGGVHNAPSNEQFNESLKARNPAWGVRDIDDIEAEAAKAALALEEMIDMPANNRVLIFRKRP